MISVMIAVGLTGLWYAAWKFDGVMIDLATEHGAVHESDLTLATLGVAVSWITAVQALQPLG